jgi:formylglycine-generating enzyme required for sulfatase activity
MDYLQSLELQMASLQRKFRLLQDLRFFMDTASSEELSLFGEALRSIIDASGTSLASDLAKVIGAGPETRPITSQPRSTDRPTSPSSHAAPTSAAPEMPGASAAAPLAPTGSEDSPAPQRREETTPEAARSTAAGDSAKAEAVALVEPSMVAIPASSFIMGSEANDAEKPPHKVGLSPYRISDHLATNKEFSLFIAANPQWSKDRAAPDLRDDHYLEDWNGDAYPEGKDEHPVAFVSYFAAQAFAEWLGKRLPTEAEWECAARGGLVGKKYPNGDLMNEKLANLAKQYRGTTSVRKFEPNGFKLYDMAGNLFEWCADWYGPYASGETRDPKGPADGEYRVARGGSWMSGAGALRVSSRVDMESVTCAQVGIRVADGGTSA